MRENRVFQEELFPLEELYRFIEEYAQEKGLVQTSAALPFMKKSHAGQVRKGPARVPYIYHPLSMARHSIAMGLTEDEVLAAILLHDVCEDCGVAPEELPVNKTVQEAVVYLSFQKPEGMTKAQAKAVYFAAIEENKVASLVKLLDRCNNISAMAGGFTKERMVQYIEETESYLLPLCNRLKEQYEEYRNPLFILEYQIRSVMESLKVFL